MFLGLGLKKKNEHWVDRGWQTRGEKRVKDGGGGGEAGNQRNNKGGRKENHHAYSKKNRRWPTKK